MEQEIMKVKESRKVPYVLLGAAVGAALGVLYAPKAGKQTREEVESWVKNRRGKLPQFLTKIRQEFPFRKEQLAAALKAGRQAYLENAKDHHANGRKAIRA